MLKARIKKLDLNFKFTAGTSRGSLKTNTVYFIIISDPKKPDKIGIGECNYLKGLSIDDVPGYEEKLLGYCPQINDPILEEEGLRQYPSILFGLETALKDLKNGGNRILFDNSFSRGETGIPINGLIWMGTLDQMKERLDQKIQEGYNCIKIKIGAINWEDELNFLRKVRKQYSHNDLEIRVDANGAFKPEDAQRKLEALYQFHIHSIEQPIKAGLFEEMSTLIRNAPFPVALDEELIPHITSKSRYDLLEYLMPHFLILKPSLLGGFRATDEWIDIAGRLDIDWWVTSALESNIGLNAIAQYTASKENELPQGLGTGQLYNNNIPSPLIIKNRHLEYRKNANWGLEFFEDV